MSDAAHTISAKPALVADFNWEDPLDLEGQLTEEERMIRDSVREFAEDKLASRVKSAFRDERFDREIMTEAGELGLMGIMTDPAYGGQGLGYVAYGLIAREIERVDSGYRSAISVQNSLVMHPIEAYGSEVQKKNEEECLGRVELVLVEGPSKKSTEDSPALTGRTDTNKRCVFEEKELAQLPAFLEAVKGEAMGKRLPRKGDYVAVTITAVRGHGLVARPMALTTNLEFQSLASKLVVRE